MTPSPPASLRSSGPIGDYRLQTKRSDCGLTRLQSWAAISEMAFHAQRAERCVLLAQAYRVEFCPPALGCLSVPLNVQHRRRTPVLPEKSQFLSVCRDLKDETVKPIRPGVRPLLLHFSGEVYLQKRERPRGAPFLSRRGDSGPTSYERRPSVRLKSYGPRGYGPGPYNWATGQTARRVPRAGVAPGLTATD